MTRISPWISGISSIVTEKRLTDIIGWPSVSPTSTSVKVSEGEGRMLASAVPLTRTGWPRMRVGLSLEIGLVVVPVDEPRRDQRREQRNHHEAADDQVEAVQGSTPLWSPRFR